MDDGGMTTPEPHLAAAIGLMTAAAANPGDHTDDSLLEAVIVHTTGLDEGALRKVIALLTDRLAMTFADTQWRQLHDQAGACGFQMPDDPAPLTVEHRPENRR